MLHKNITGPPIISITPNLWDEKLTYFGPVAEKGKEKLDQRRSPEPWTCSGNTLFQHHKTMKLWLCQSTAISHITWLKHWHCVLWTAQRRNLLSWRADGYQEARAGLGAFAEDNEATIKMENAGIFSCFLGVAKWLFCGRFSVFSRENDPFEFFSSQRNFPLFIFYLGCCCHWSQDFLQIFLWGMRLGINLNNSFYMEVLNLSMLPSFFFFSFSFRTQSPIQDCPWAKLLEGNLNAS